jgi:hypothetical protein
VDPTPNCVVQFCPALDPLQPQFVLLVDALMQVNVAAAVSLHSVSFAGHEHTPLPVTMSGPHVDPTVFEQLNPS